MQTSASQEPGKLRIEAPVVDGAIHHRWSSEEEVLDYLEPAWRHYVGHRGQLPGGAGMRAWMPRPRWPNPSGPDLARKASSAPAALASEAGTLLEEYLRPHGVDRALLLFDEGMFVAANPNPYLATGLVRALNDWTIERWLERDQRLYGVALVPMQTPEEAVSELRRVGDHPKIAAVMVGAPVLGKTLGHPVYLPVYREAERLGLPLVIHTGVEGLLDVPTGPAAGHPMTFAEYYANLSLGVTAQLTSFITNGVLDQLPSLRLYLVGTGLAWVPGFMMRVELITHELRREVPWMRRTVQEYLAEHVRVSSYGLERGPGAEIVARLSAQNELLERILLFGSGFPSWDTVATQQVADLVSESWSRAVFHDTAVQWFRWPEPCSGGGRT